MLNKDFGHFKLMGDPNLVNNEIAFYEEVKASEMQNIAMIFLKREFEHFILPLNDV